MTCGGCSSAIDRILSKIDGVTDIKIDVEAKSVVVTHEESVSSEEMLEKLMKWSKASGKSVKLLS